MCLLFCQVCHGVTANDIVKYARKQIGSFKWTKDSEHFLGAGKWKCNIFVADVLKHVKADAPNR